MRNLIMTAGLAATFFAVGIVQPNLLIAQDSIEDDLQNERPGARIRRDRGEDTPDLREDFRARDGEIRGRREDVRDRGETVNDRRENYRDRRGNRPDRRENYQNRLRGRRALRKDVEGNRGYRRDHRRDFQSHRGNRREHKRDFRSQRKVRQDHKRYFSSSLDRRKRSFAKQHRYGHSSRSYKRAGGRMTYRR